MNILKTYLKKCPCVNVKTQYIVKLPKIILVCFLHDCLVLWQILICVTNALTCHYKTDKSLMNLSQRGVNEQKSCNSNRAGKTSMFKRKSRSLLGVVYGKASTSFIAKVAKKVHFKLVQKNISSIYFEFSLPLRNKVKRTFLSFEERVSIASTVIIKQGFSTF